jgi:NAD+ kinase
MVARAGAPQAQVLVIYKKSSYQIYVKERRNERVQSLLDAGDQSVASLVRAHEQHAKTMELARTLLQQLGARAVFRYRADPGTTEAFDLIVTIGGDGTLLWASHMVGSTVPMLAVNSAPKDSVGYFCAGTGAELGDLLQEALRGTLHDTRLSRMRVTLDDERVSNRVLNDALFAHHCAAATTRYVIEHAGERAEHKSSGVWVGPAAGSTAAQHSAGGAVMPIGSRRLQFVVREPYRDHGRAPELVRGFVAPGESLELHGRIRAGRLYVDGPHLAREVDMGSRLRFELSDEPLHLLGFRDRDRSRS